MQLHQRCSAKSNGRARLIIHETVRNSPPPEYPIRQSKISISPTAALIRHHPGVHSTFARRSAFVYVRAPARNESPPAQTLGALFKKQKAAAPGQRGEKGTGRGGEEVHAHRRSVQLVIEPPLGGSLAGTFKRRLFVSCCSASASFLARGRRLKPSARIWVGSRENLDQKQLLARAEIASDLAGAASTGSETDCARTRLEGRLLQWSCFRKGELATSCCCFWHFFSRGSRRFLCEGRIGSGVGAILRIKVRCDNCFLMYF